MRRILVALCLLVGSMSAVGQVSFQFGGPGVSIGINLPVYPRLQPIPGYPVYYAPGINYNYFFYDGMYWVFEDDRWYASSWYNGPWHAVDPFYVPDFVLRVPVRYYRHAPTYFRGWRADAPPRWDQHWGSSWSQRRGDWNRWDRRSAPAAAPLPSYQRQYSGTRYPRPEQQAQLHTDRYRYQPREEVSRQRYQEERRHQEERRGVAEDLRRSPDSPNMQTIPRQPRPDRPNIPTDVPGSGG